MERLVVLIMFWCWLQVCELDIIFNFEKAHFVLDEFIIGGEVQESSQKSVITAIAQQDILQEVCRVVHSYVTHAVIFHYCTATSELLTKMFVFICFTCLWLDYFHNKYKYKYSLEVQNGHIVQKSLTNDGPILIFLLPWL